MVQDGGLVEEDASAVNGSRKRHLFGMEIVERRLSPDLIGLVAQDIEKRVGGKEDGGFRSEVWMMLESAGGRDLGLVRLTMYSQERLVS
jgi:hypothetical protein